MVHIDKLEELQEAMRFMSQLHAHCKSMKPLLSKTIESWRQFSNDKVGYFEDTDQDISHTVKESLHVIQGAMAKLGSLLNNLEYVDGDLSNNKVRSD